MIHTVVKILQCSGMAISQHTSDKFFQFHDEGHCLGRFEILYSSDSDDIFEGRTRFFPRLRPL